MKFYLAIDIGASSGRRTMKLPRRKSKTGAVPLLCTVGSGTRTFLRPAAPTLA